MPLYEFYRNASNYNQKQTIPKNVKFGLIFESIWKLFVFMLWFLLGMYNSDYYRVGPSDSLYLAFVNIPIDNMGRYTAVMIYILVDTLFNVISGDFIYFWINAYIMNPNVPIHHNQWILYGITNYHWMLNSSRELFFFALAFTQIDFALAMFLSSVVGGFIASYFVIFDNNREDKVIIEDMQHQYGTL